MKRFAPIFVLLLIACNRGPNPTPADVAGVFDLHSQDGEVLELPEGFVFSTELRSDGSTFFVMIDPSFGDSAAGVGQSFSVSRAEHGCVEIVVEGDWAEEQRELVRSTVCGDSLIQINRETGWTAVFLKRRH